VTEGGAGKNEKHPCLLLFYSIFIVYFPSRKFIREVEGLEMVIKTKARGYESPLAFDCLYNYGGGNATYIKQLR